MSIKQVQALELVLELASESIDLNVDSEIEEAFKKGPMLPDEAFAIVGDMIRKMKEDGLEEESE